MNGALKHGFTVPVPVRQNTKGEIVEELGDLLMEAGMQNVLPLPKARVPVVKFVVGDNSVKVRWCPHLHRILTQAYGLCCPMSLHRRRALMWCVCDDALSLHRLRLSLALGST